LPSQGSEISASVFFGRRASEFILNCDRTHPDLRSSEFVEFFSRFDQFAAAASFCVSMGLDAPLDSMLARPPSPPKGLFSMFRVLKEPFRSGARSGKSVLFFSGSEVLSLCGDRIVSRREDSDIYLDSRDREPDLMSSFWDEAARKFGSLGCSLLAEEAAAKADRFRPSGCGFRRLSLFEASIILANKSKLESVEFALVPLSSDAPPRVSIFLSSSDHAMGGHAVFDGHVALALSEGGSLPDLDSAELFVLGDRDGSFHEVGFLGRGVRN